MWLVHSLTVMKRLAILPTKCLFFWYGLCRTTLIPFPCTSFACSRGGTPEIRYLLLQQNENGALDFGRGVLPLLDLVIGFP